MLTKLTRAQIDCAVERVQQPVIDIELIGQHRDGRLRPGDFDNGTEAADRLGPPGVVGESLGLFKTRGTRRLRVDLADGLFGQTKDSASPIVSSSETPPEVAEGTDYDPIAELEQLRRMVETEEEEEPQDEAIQPIAPTHQPAAPATHVLDNDENEESLDDYMNKLMSRVNGKSERIDPEPITPVPPKEVAPSPEPKNPVQLKRRSERPDL